MVHRSCRHRPSCPAFVPGAYPACASPEPCTIALPHCHLVLTVCFVYELWLLLATVLLWVWDAGAPKLTT
jgi:hypothetical protein